MLKEEIKSIISPKGEIGGIAFTINYIILLLLSTICSFSGFCLVNKFQDKYGSMPFFAILIYLLLVINIVVIIFTVFNYKRRFLNITKKLPISIILGILFGIALEIVAAILYFNYVLFAIVFRFVLPLIAATIPSKDANKKEYWTTYFTRWKEFLKNKITIFVLVVLILDLIFTPIYFKKKNKNSNISPEIKLENQIIIPKN